MELNSLPGAGDDGLDRPQVTPAPTPPDDRLLRIAAISAVVGGVVTLLGLRWIHRNLVISRRHP